MTDIVDKATAWDAIAAKNAEIARLRAALRDIHASAKDNHLIANIARAALAPPAGETIDGLRPDRRYNVAERLFGDD